MTRSPKAVERCLSLQSTLSAASGLEPVRVPVTRRSSTKEKGSVRRELGEAFRLLPRLLPDTQTLCFFRSLVSGCALWHITDPGPAPRAPLPFTPFGIRRIGDGI